MVLPAPAAVPPTVLFAAASSIHTPVCCCAMPAVPAALVPIKFPSTTLPVVPEVTTPHAFSVVAGDHVARARGRAADDVVLGAVVDRYALVGIAQIGRAGHIQADVVPDHDVAASARRAGDLDAIDGVARDDVAISGTWSRRSCCCCRAVMETPTQFRFAAVPVASVPEEVAHDDIVRRRVDQDRRIEAVDGQPLDRAAVAAGVQIQPFRPPAPGRRAR